MQGYEPVIGLEIHVQLATQSKLFCGDPVQFGAAPNTLVSPISLAYPGTLPRINQKAVESAVQLGLAFGCEIAPVSYFARKHYFYPDLPRGYQTSQHTHPICIGGAIKIKQEAGSLSFALNRIHLEDDAGKSIHDLYGDTTCIDLNRAGTALLEIVTEPVIHHPDHAAAVVAEIRKMVRWLGIGDGNMEAGNLRCDANISLRVAGTKELGTKVEVKNLNSIRFVKKAIEFEIERMEKLLEQGEKIQQQTRSFNAINFTTFATREKEEAHDYRYFPDPDLPPIRITQERLNNIQSAMTALPSEIVATLQTHYKLSEYDAEQITQDKTEWQLFLATANICTHYKSIANWMQGPIRQWRNEKSEEEENILEPTQLAELIELVESGTVSFTIAAQKIFPLMVTTQQSALQIAEEGGWIQEKDTQQLETWVNEVLAAMPEQVAAYKKGKKGLIGLFVGEVKKRSRGKADLKWVTTYLEQQLTSTK